jgi:DNA invertase Pin-like site-specific DNA recombinase
VLETLQHLNRLTGYGVAWRSYTEMYLDSTGIFRDAVIGILAAVAKQERVRRSERTLAGLQKARAKGVVLGRRPVVVNVEQIQRLRAEGRSWQAVSELNSCCVFTAKFVLRIHA